jgi:hypothetical protein
LGSCDEISFFPNKLLNQFSLFLLMFQACM